MKFFEISGQLSFFAHNTRKIFKEERVEQFTLFKNCSDGEITYDLHRNK